MDVLYHSPTRFADATSSRAVAWGFLLCRSWRVSGTPENAFYIKRRCLLLLQILLHSVSAYALFYGKKLSFLHLLKEQEEENRLLFGRGYNRNDYVFKWPDGKPFAPDFVTRHFSNLLRNNGLPHIRFHELRHSCASLLLNNGSTLKDVQEYLGHSNIKTTADIYGHLDMMRKNQLSDLLESQIL